MNSKILRRERGIDALVMSFVLGALTFLVTRMTLHLLGDLSLKYTARMSAAIWALAIALNHCLISKLPYTGPLIAVSESSGLILGLSIFFWPLPVWEIGLIWIGLYVVSHCSSLARIARLKKQSYTEELH